MSKPKIRLYVPGAYVEGAELVLALAQAHYVAHVMRAGPGDRLLVFNGADGEWLAEISAIAKKSLTLTLKNRLRAQISSPDLWLAFAPIKNKTELVVEKATELGVAKLLPVFMQHSVVTSVNQDKLSAHAVEAAEQCERLDVPAIEPQKNLGAMLAAWPKDRTLLYGDESGGGEPLKEVIHRTFFSPRLRGEPEGGEGKNNTHPHLTSPASGGAMACAVLIGPEGGFSAEEHRLLKSQPFVKPFGMGPRILRADTAAVATLACMQATLGDWQIQPHFKVS